MANVSRGQSAAIKILSKNQQVISDIADSIWRVPPSVDSYYLAVVQRAANFLGGNGVVEVDSTARPVTVGPDMFSTKGSASTPFFVMGSKDSDADAGLRNAAMAARNGVIDVISRVNSFVARAKASGFAPPSNPFMRIADLNASRSGDDSRVIVPETEASDMIESMNIFMRFVKAERDGTLNLERTTPFVSQLSSVTMQLDGYGGSGNNVADLMRFLPDMDALKEQKARESLAVLDFKKRTPKMIFSANYSPDNQLRGSLIGWKRIADASGYVIRRKNLFDLEETSWTLDNEKLKSIYAGVKEYVNTWALSFYESIDPEFVCVFIDGTVKKHSYYSYSVQAYQLANINEGTIFSVETAPFNLSVARRLELRAQLEKLDPGIGPDTISPWPVISNSFFGSPFYDWMLAGVNTRKSISRSDPRSQTRKFSYLSAQLDYIFSQMDAGNFVMPVDVNQVAKNMLNSISKFGVTQVILEVLRETGMLYHFEGKDVQEDTHFSRIGSVDLQTSNLMGVVAAAIDPETATLDLRTLASNMPALIAGFGNMSTDTKLTPGVDPFVQGVPAEVSVPNQESLDSRAEDDVQFIKDLGRLRDGQVDLTSFDGISKLVRTIRIMSDFGANRGAPISDTGQSLTERVLLPGERAANADIIRAIQSMGGQPVSAPAPTPPPSENRPAPMQRVD